MCETKQFILVNQIEGNSKSIIELSKTIYMARTNGIKTKVVVFSSLSY